MSILSIIPRVLTVSYFLLFVAVFRFAAVAADGELDPYFRTGVGVNGGVNAVALQTDGKILIGGWFTQVEGVSNARIGRLNPDGSVDMTFRPGLGFDDDVLKIVVQPDGKILVAGEFRSFDGEARSYLTRLNPDGSRDTSFAAGDGQSRFEQGFIQEVVLQPDGKILVGGYFKFIGGANFNNIARLNSDGTADPGFVIGTGTGTLYPNGSRVYGLALQPDGKVLVGGEFFYFNGVFRHRMARLMANGSVDPSFVPQISGFAYVSGIGVQPDGKILFGGGADPTFLHRLNADGSPDPTFVSSSGVLDTTADIDIQEDGKIRVTSLGITRFLSNGEKDPSFVVDSEITPKSSAIQPDGQVVIGGQFVGARYGAFPHRIGRLLPNGSYDQTFAVRRYVGAGGWLAVQPDGKIITDLPLTQFDIGPLTGITRRNRDGTFDHTFNPGSGANDQINYAEALPDSRILIVGNFSSFNSTPRPGIAILNSNGSLDLSFTPAFIGRGQFATGKYQPDGKILLTSNYTTSSSQGPDIARLNPDGSIDTSFNPPTIDPSNGTVVSIALQPDGKILLMGFFTSIGGVTSVGIARLNYDGSHDASFDVGEGAGGQHPFIYKAAIQNDGKILIGGQFSRYKGVARNRFARLNPDGSLDASFRHDLVGEHSKVRVNDILVQRDGKILFTRAQEDTTFRYNSQVVRVDQTGLLDPSFFIDTRYVVDKIAMESDGSVVGTGGTYEEAPWIPMRRGLVRYLNPSQMVTMTTVSGRVTTPSGMGIRNAVVTIVDQTGVIQRATTSSFGVFTFDLVPTGQNYTVVVSSKRYRFSPMTVAVTGAISGLDLVGLE